MSGGTAGPVVAPLGDGAVRVTFPSASAVDVPAWCRALERARIPGVLGTIPSAVSVVVTCDPAAGPWEDLARALSAVRAAPGPAPSPPLRVVLPVTYGGEDGPDLPAVAALAGIDPGEVVRRHGAPTYRVTMIGFSPGFPYLSGLDPSLAVPRLERPRPRVPAGSVGIGGRQAGVYPQGSPGGWRIIGRTRLALFDHRLASPCVLAPGDEVRFAPVHAGAPRPRIDLNCDVGEGYPGDEELCAVATSVNIACGGHAGDERSMAEAVARALRGGAAVGAHPGYADREGFGRRVLVLPAGTVAAQVAEQVRVLEGIAAAQGAVLSHVKLHGALYNAAARDEALAGALVRALAAATPCSVLFALAGSALAEVARAAGFAVAEEAFPDRGYRADGSLAPRGEAGSVVESAEESAARGMRMAAFGVVDAVDGARVRLRADTLCIHGDAPGAVAAARALRRALDEAGIDVRRFASP